MACTKLHQSVFLHANEYFRTVKLVKTILGLIPLLAIQPAIAQQVEPARTWSSQEIKVEFGNDYEGMPIYRVYEYRDKGGLWNVVLCENHAVVSEKDTANTRIKAIGLLNDHGGYVSKWTINDAVIKKDPADELVPENHIWFWSKYTSFTDLDGDGLVDPLIVYGTESVDEAFQRIKFIILHKGRKYAIRAVECVLDDCRKLKYDDAYKTLPAVLRKKVDALMERMRKEQDIILHDG